MGIWGFRSRNKGTSLHIRKVRSLSGGCWVGPGLSALSAQGLQFPGGGGFLGSSPFLLSASESSSSALGSLPPHPYQALCQSVSSEVLEAMTNMDKARVSIPYPPRDSPGRAAAEGVQISPGVKS